MISPSEFLKWLLVYGVPIGGGGGGDAVTQYQVQQWAFNYASIDSGTATAFHINLTPAPVALTDGLEFNFLPANSNEANPTMQVNGLTPVPIVGQGGVPLPVGAIYIGEIAKLIYNAGISSFVLQNPLQFVAPLPMAQIFVGSSAGAAIPVPMSGDATMTDAGVVTVADMSGAFGVDSGTANAYVLTLTPAIASYSDSQIIGFVADNSNNNTSTVAVSGLPTTPIVTNGNSALSGGEIVAGGYYEIIYNAGYSSFVLLNSSLATGGGANYGQILQASLMLMGG